MLKRGTWSTEEDQRLMELVETTKPLKWVHVAAAMGTRTSKQCRERYHNYLNPTLSRSPITPDEGRKIEELVRIHGKRWAEISRHLPGRSDNAIKNWWNAGPQRRRGSTDLALRPTSSPATSLPSASSTLGTYGQMPQMSSQMPSQMQPQMSSQMPSQMSSQIPSHMGPQMGPHLVHTPQLGAHFGGQIGSYRAVPIAPQHTSIPQHLATPTSPHPMAAPSSHRNQSAQAPPPMEPMADQHPRPGFSPDNTTFTGPHRGHQLNHGLIPVGHSAQGTAPHSGPGSPSPLTTVSNGVSGTPMGPAGRGTSLRPSSPPPPPVAITFNETYAEPAQPQSPAAPQFNGFSPSRPPVPLGGSPSTSPRNSFSAGPTGGAQPPPIPLSGAFGNDDHLPDPLASLSWHRHASYDWVGRRSSVESVHTDLSQFSLAATTPSPGSRRGSAAVDTPNMYSHRPQKPTSLTRLSIASLTEDLSTPTSS